MDEFAEVCPVGELLEAQVASSVGLRQGAPATLVEEMQGEARRKLRGLLLADVASEMYASVAVLLHQAAMERMSAAGQRVASRGGYTGPEVGEAIAAARAMDVMLRGVAKTRTVARQVLIPGITVRPRGEG